MASIDIFGWADKLPFLLVSYVIAFFPWVYFAVSDHVTARWEPAQRLVKRSWIALIVVLFSTAMLIAYIVIQFGGGDRKEALAAVVVLLAGFGPYVRSAREFWIIYAFRDFERLLSSIPTFRFEKPPEALAEAPADEHDSFTSRFFPTIKCANSSSFFDNDHPGDGVLDLSLKQWFINRIFCCSAKRRRKRRVRLDTISVREFLSWDCPTDDQISQFTSTERYRDAMSIFYYETRALKSTSYNTVLKYGFFHLLYHLECLIRDFIRGYPSKRITISRSKKETLVPWRRDYDYLFEDTTFLEDNSARQAWMYENVFTHTHDAQRLLRFVFMVSVADEVVSSISSFCLMRKQVTKDGRIKEWDTTFSHLGLLTKEKLILPNGAELSLKLRKGLLKYDILSTPVRTHEIVDYMEAHSRLPGTRKTSSEFHWLNWADIAHLLSESIELWSISNGLFEAGDSLKCDGIYEPALWNVLFCRQIILYRRARAPIIRVGYALNPGVAEELISGKTFDVRSHWNCIDENIKKIVDNLIICAKREPHFMGKELQNTLTTNAFEKIIEESEAIVRGCLNARNAEDVSVEESTQGRGFVFVPNVDTSREKIEEKTS